VWGLARPTQVFSHPTSYLSLPKGVRRGSTLGRQYKGDITPLAFLKNGFLKSFGFPLDVYLTSLLLCGVFFRVLWKLEDCVVAASFLLLSRGFEPRFRSKRRETGCTRATGSTKL
jgi:hypothetical protein